MCSFKSFHYRYLNIRRKIAERRKVALNIDAENANFIKDDSSSLNNQLKRYFKIKPECFKGRSNSISLYQTCIMMMTITAISAVDFKIFPRRFRKSKTFGISLVKIKLGLFSYKFVDGRWCGTDNNRKWTCHVEISSWPIKNQI